MIEHPESLSTRSAASGESAPSSADATEVLSVQTAPSDPFMTDVVGPDELARLEEAVFAEPASIPRERRDRRGARTDDGLDDTDAARAMALVADGSLVPAPPTEKMRAPRFSFRGRRSASPAVSPLGAAAAAEHRGAETQAVQTSLSELHARSISAWFGDHQVLLDVSLTMPAGQVTALIGPSGCGKSTFLRILNRMHELVPSASLAGEVLLDGDDVYDPGHRLIDARKHIGMVFQKPNPFPSMSIYDNVIAGLKLTGIRASRDQKDELVETSLQGAGLWKEVKDRLRAPGGGLSGGQQQRLCIARSLAIKPKVLLMDEPCSALDPTSTRVIEETMGELQKELTIVIVTHNMQQAQRVSQQCAFFLASQGQPGHIVEHGDTEAMFDSPLDPRTYDYVNGRFG